MNEKNSFESPEKNDNDFLLEMENQRAHPTMEINFLKETANPQIQTRIEAENTPLKGSHFNENKPELIITEKNNNAKQALLDKTHQPRFKFCDPEAAKRCIKRHIFSRLGFKFLILFLMASTLFAVLFYFNRISAVEGSGEFVPSEKKFALSIETSFCKVVIKEHNSSSIKYDYKLNYLLDFKNSTAPNITNAGNKASILLKSSKKLWRTCVFTFMIPSDLTLTEFNVNCTSECIIISVHPRISIDKGEWVSSQRLDMNWRNLYVKEALKFNSSTGTLQLNEFRVDGIASIKLDIGDVILQSTSDIKLNWTNPSLAYCFAGPVVKEESSQQCSSDLRGKGTNTTNINNGNNTSTKTNTTSNASNTTGICSGVSTICKTETCSSPSAVTVSQISGNTYFNLLPETGVDVSYNPSLQIAQGYPNNDSVSLEDSLEKEILKIYNISIKERDPILIVNVGPRHLQQQSYQKWVVSSNPSFSYLRPWWLAVFSINLLTAKTLDFTGTLAPGSCPYHFFPTINDLAKVQNSLMSFFNLSRAEYSFVQPMNTEWPGENPLNGTGVSEFYNGKPVSEDWIKDEKNTENQFLLKPIDILTHQFVLPTLILSFTGAAMIGVFVTRLFMAAVVTLNKKITDIANHTEKYKKNIIDLLRATEAEKNNRELNEVGNEEEDVRINIGEILRESSFAEFMKTVPRMSAFVGFASYSWLKKYLLNSVRAFCDAIFTEKEKEPFDKMVKSTKETEKLQVKEIRLKFNYERFCFLNHYSEKSLVENERIFMVYGYHFVPDKEALAFPFLVEKKTAQLPEVKELQQKSDEDVFDTIFNSIYEKSELESDTIFMDEIKNNYDFYCNKYRFPKNSDLSDEEFAVRNNLKKIYKSGLKLVYNGTIKRPRPVIWVFIVLRILDFIWWPIWKIFKYQSPFKPTCERLYIFDEEGLQMQFNFLSKRDSHSEIEASLLEESEIKAEKEAEKKTVFYRFFYLHEVLFIVFHFTVTFLFIAPFLLMVLLYEINYEPYSTVSQDELISLKDSLWTTLELPFRIPAFIEWNQAIIGLIISFSIVNVIDDLLYFFNMEFPEDRKFLEFQKQTNDSHYSCIPDDCPRFMNTTWGLRHLNIFLWERHTVIRRLLINIYWCFVLFLVFCYCSYIGLVMLWLLLGAIINPNNFLVYATSSLTFLTFVSVKYNQFTSLTADGMKGIREIVERLLKEKMKAITGVLSQELGKTITRVKGISQVAALTNFAESQAKDFGLDREFAEMKSLSENPEKILGQIFSNMEHAIVDPEELKSKFARKKEEWYNLAKNAFRTKCRTYKIDDKVIDLLIELNLKIDRNQLVIILSSFLGTFLEKKFGITWPTELTQSLVSLVSTHKTPENRKEIYSQLAKNILEKVLTYFNPSLSKSADKLVSFIMDQGGDDKTKIIFEIVPIAMSLLDIDPPPLLKSFNDYMLPLLDQSQSNPNSEKEIKKILINMISEKVEDKRLREFIVFILLFDKTQGESDLFGVKLNDLEALTNFFEGLFIIKITDLPTMVATVCQLLKGFHQGDNAEKFKNSFNKILNKLDITKLTKPFSDLFNLLIELWSAKLNSEDKAKLAEKRISYEYFLDIVCLLTENLWRNYTDDRIYYLERAETTIVIANKIGFNKPDHLVNLLSICWNSDKNSKQELVQKFYTEIKSSGYKCLNVEKVKNIVSLFEAKGQNDNETLKTIERNVEVFSSDLKLNKDYLHKLILLLNGIEKEKSLEFILRNTAIMKDRELGMELTRLIISQEEKSKEKSYMDVFKSFFLEHKESIQIGGVDVDFKGIVEIIYSIGSSGNHKWSEASTLLKKTEKEIVIEPQSTFSVLDYLGRKKLKGFDECFFGFYERELKVGEGELEVSVKKRSNEYKKLLLMATILNWNNKTELEDFFSAKTKCFDLFEDTLSDLKITEKSELESMLELKHYFSFEPKSFSANFLKSDREVLEAILSFLDRNPDYKLISQYLKVSRYQVESVISFLEFWKMRKGDPQAVEKLRILEESGTTALWCEKLEIVKAELFALLRIHYNLLTDQDIDKMITDLNIADVVKVSEFKNLVSLFSKRVLPEIQGKNKEREFSIFRKKLSLLKDLGVENPKNFLFKLEFQAGNFHNLQTLYRYCQGPQERIQSNRILKIYFYVLGCMICHDVEDIQPHNILKEFIGLNPLELKKNSFKSIAYWLFKDFYIHPLILIYKLNNHPQTISYVNRIFKDRGLLKDFKKYIENINGNNTNNTKMEREEFTNYCITLFEEQDCLEYIKDKRHLWANWIVKCNNLSVINLITKVKEDLKPVVEGKKLDQDEIERPTNKNPSNLIQTLINIQGTRQKDTEKFENFKDFIQKINPDEKKASDLFTYSREYEHLIRSYENKHGKGDRKISDLLQLFLNDSQNKTKSISGTLNLFSDRIKSNWNKLDLLLLIINLTESLENKGEEAKKEEGGKKYVDSLINLLEPLGLELYLFGSIKPMLELNSEDTDKFNFIEEAIKQKSLQKQQDNSYEEVPYFTFNKCLDFLLDRWETWTDIKRIIKSRIFMYIGSHQAWYEYIDQESFKNETLKSLAKSLICYFPEKKTIDRYFNEESLKKESLLTLINYGFTFKYKDKEASFIREIFGEKCLVPYGYQSAFQIMKAIIKKDFLMIALLANDLSKESELKFSGGLRVFDHSKVSSIKDSKGGIVWEGPIAKVFSPKGSGKKLSQIKYEALDENAIISIKSSLRKLSVTALNRHLKKYEGYKLQPDLILTEDFLEDDYYREFRPQISLIALFLGRPNDFLTLLNSGSEIYSVYAWSMLPSFSAVFSADYSKSPQDRRLLSAYLAWPLLKICKKLKNNVLEEDLKKVSSFLMKNKDKLFEVVNYYSFIEPRSNSSILSFLANIKNQLLNDLKPQKKDEEGVKNQLINDLKPQEKDKEGVKNQLKNDPKPQENDEEWEEIAGIFKSFTEALGSIESDLITQIPLLYKFVELLGNIINNDIQWDDRTLKSISELLDLFIEKKEKSTQIKYLIGLFIYMFSSAQKLTAFGKNKDFKSMAGLFIDIVFTAYCHYQQNSQPQSDLALDSKVINLKKVLWSLKLLINHPVFPYNDSKEYFDFLRILIEPENLRVENEEKQQASNKSSNELPDLSPYTIPINAFERKKQSHDNKEEPSLISEVILDICEESFKLIEFMKNQEKSSNKDERRRQIISYMGFIADKIFAGMKIQKIMVKDCEIVRRKVKVLFKNIVYLIKAEFEAMTPDFLMVFGLDLDRSQADLVKNLLIGFRDMTKGVARGPQQYIDAHFGGISEKITGTNLSSAKSIMQKVAGNEDISFADFFKLCDKDKNGDISLMEFKILTRRLGIDLSDHRIKEIFTAVKIKAGANLSANNLALNENELELSIKYLQDKSVFLSLEALGLNQEFLVGLLIFLIILLLVIFAFIFIGVEAFAVAGTFGAIVNSIFPIAGGAVLNSKSNNKYADIITSEEFKSTVRKCIKIVQSMKI